MWFNHINKFHYPLHSRHKRTHREAPPTGIHPNQFYCLCVTLFKQTRLPVCTNYPDIIRRQSVLVSCLGKMVTLNTSPTLIKGVHRQTSYRKALYTTLKRKLHCLCHGSVQSLGSSVFRPQVTNTIKQSHLFNKTKPTYLSKSAPMSVSGRHESWIFLRAHGPAGNTA